VILLQDRSLYDDVGRGAFQGGFFDGRSLLARENILESSAS
jgi:hypothetical protein